jgi:hypothetical protein
VNALQDGKTPLDFAVLKGRAPVAALLREVRARRTTFQLQPRKIIQNTLEFKPTPEALKWI